MPRWSVDVEFRFYYINTYIPRQYLINNEAEIHKNTSRSRGVKEAIKATVSVWFLLYLSVYLTDICTIVIFAG